MSDILCFFLLKTIGMNEIYVNPANPIKTVFVFPIHNALKQGIAEYEATRRAWRVSERNQSLRHAFAVGLKDYISITSYEIAAWNPDEQEPEKMAFESPLHPFPSTYYPLSDQNWSYIIEITKGYWQFGRHLIVEFDGAGKFRIKSGSRDHSWHNCIKKSD